MKQERTAEGSPPEDELPKVWGDYNAFGLSAEDDDNCIYSLHRDQLTALSPNHGMKVFVYDDDIAEDGSEEVFGYVCKLERVEWAVGGWRARPDESTWYRGPKSW